MDQQQILRLARSPQLITHLLLQQHRPRLPESWDGSFTAPEKTAWKFHNGLPQPHRKQFAQKVTNPHLQRMLATRERRITVLRALAANPDLDPEAADRLLSRDDAKITEAVLVHCPAHRRVALIRRHPGRWRTPSAPLGRSIAMHPAGADEALRELLGDENVPATTVAAALASALACGRGRLPWAALLTVLAELDRAGAIDANLEWNLLSAEVRLPGTRTPHPSRALVELTESDTDWQRVPGPIPRLMLLTAMQRARVELPAPAEMVHGLSELTLPARSHLQRLLHNSGKPLRDADVTALHTVGFTGWEGLRFTGAALVALDGLGALTAGLISRCTGDAWECSGEAERVAMLNHAHLGEEVLRTFRWRPEADLAGLHRAGASPEALAKVIGVIGPYRRVLRETDEDAARTLPLEALLAPHARYPGALWPIIAERALREPAASPGTAHHNALCQALQEPDDWTDQAIGRICDQVAALPPEDQARLVTDSAHRWAASKLIVALLDVLDLADPALLPALQSLIRRHCADWRAHHERAWLDEALWRVPMPWPELTQSHYAARAVTRAIERVLPPEPPDGGTGIPVSLPLVMELLHSWEGSLEELMTIVAQPGADPATP
ncbi:hypothetical protein [Bailinhaonella thermotolerans]|uniref:Uncharacterized protein n=1 Tax=Bailinhaonella thermotolerans TaxID=1070861 RepID=A0A3A4A676_9ACTN|nr:hypothetical protein [Bailinhaonella thermotolerans]RJL21217.1 hypothetical protein D5H75_37765 [Bailinhaonella thermotolerans]